MPFSVFERGFDDVETDAASGDFGDFVGGAEAGRENQLETFELVELLGFLGGDNSALDGAADDFFAVEPFAVVGDFDHDLIAVVIGVQADRAARGFSGRLALRGRFDAVVGGVADQVRQRIGERVENALVEVGVLSGDFERDVLVAQLARRRGRSAESGGKAARREPCGFSSPIFAVHRARATETPARPRVFRAEDPSSGGVRIPSMARCSMDLPMIISPTRFITVSMRAASTRSMFSAAA